MVKQADNNSAIKLAIICFTLIVLFFSGYFIYRDISNQRKEDKKSAQNLEIKKAELRQSCQKEYNDAIEAANRLPEPEYRYSINLEARMAKNSAGTALNKCLENADSIK